MIDPGTSAVAASHGVCATLPNLPPAPLAVCEIVASDAQAITGTFSDHTILIFELQ